MKEIITELLKTKREKLSPSSVKTYVSLLYSMYNRNKNETDDGTNKEWFAENVKKVLASFKNLEPNRRKTQLSALYIVTTDPDVHREMLSDVQKTNDENKLQKKTQKQEDGWMTIDEIKVVYENLKEIATKMLNNKLPIDYEQIVQFFLMGFLAAGVSGLSPRRSLDYCLLKYKNYDIESDNYIDKKGILHFNTFKTKKFYGAQELNLKVEAPALYELLKKWYKINPSEYVLFSSTEQPLTSSNITKIFGKIFNKPISTNLFRHIFLSDQYKDVPALLKMQNIAQEMGHSLDMALQYVKK